MLPSLTLKHFDQLQTDYNFDKRSWREVDASYGNIHPTLIQFLFSFDQEMRVDKTLMQTLACQLSCNSCSCLDYRLQVKRTIFRFIYLWLIFHLFGSFDFFSSTTFSRRPNAKRFPRPDDNLRLKCWMESENKKHVGKNVTATTSIVFHFFSLVTHREKSSGGSDMDVIKL